jgi:hypothetical protein
MGWKFGSYTSAYAAPREFRRMCSSLSDKVDLSIVHVGRYLGYDDKELLHAAKMKVMDIAIEYGCEVIGSPPMTEFQKRSQAPRFAKLRNIDFLLIIDSDEYIDMYESDWEKFKQACIDTAVHQYHGMYNIFGIKVEDGPQNYRVMPRLWYQPEFVYYDNTHYGLKSLNPRCPYVQINGSAEKHPIIETIPFLTIKSDQSLRTEYEKANDEGYAYVLNNLDTYGLITRDK